MGGHETAKTRSEDMGEKYVKVAVIPNERKRKRKREVEQ